MTYDDSDAAQRELDRAAEKVGQTSTEDKNSAVSAKYDGTVSDTGELNLNEALYRIGSDDARYNFGNTDGTVVKSTTSGYGLGASPEEDYLEEESSEEGEGANTLDDVEEALDNTPSTFF